jgi:type II secretion system protein G
MRSVKLAIAAGCVGSALAAILFARMDDPHGFSKDPIDTVASHFSRLWRRMTPDERGCGGVFRVEADCQNLATQIMMFEVLNGRLPTSEEGIEALVVKPAATDLRKWRQLMSIVPRDPWDRPYQIRTPAWRSKDSFDIYSLGPDGVVSADDIGNW